MCPLLYKLTVWIFGAITVTYLSGCIISLFDSKLGISSMAVQFSGKYLWVLFVDGVRWLTMMLVVRRLAIWIVSGDFTLVPKIGSAAANIFVISYFFLLLALVAFVGTMINMVAATSDAALFIAGASLFAAPILIGAIAAPGIFILIPTFIWVELISVRNEGFLPRRNRQ